MTKKKSTPKKTVSKKDVNSFLILLASFVIIAITLIRVISPEDTWICQKGQWVKHGNPSTFQPTSDCPTE
jgi:hypothetical protein